MKTFFAALLLVSADAFVPTTNVRFGVPSTALNNSESPSEAMAAALEASKTFGATSKEARVAWDIVEEINASDNRYENPNYSSMYMMIISYQR